MIFVHIFIEIDLREMLQQLVEKLNKQMIAVHLKLTNQRQEQR